MSRILPQAHSNDHPPHVLLLDFDGGDHGHRGQYNAMLERLFPVQRARFTLGTVLARAPILVPQIEQAPVAFTLTCVVRSMLGRRTVGFLMRPLPTLLGTGWRLRLKRAMLKVLRRTPGAQVLTIIPFAIEPRFDRIAHGWIYDLQNWDMLLERETACTPKAQALADTIAGQAAGRKVCCAIGRQDVSKGFDAFAWLYSQSEAIQRTMLFAFGGKVDRELERDAEALIASGGFALNRFISDDELRGLYEAADLVWCAYDPDYDQASGILGRAMQLGIPVIARPGSIVARLCDLEGHPWAADAQDQDWARNVSALAPVASAEARARTRRHGEYSLARLAQALGTPARPIETLAPGSSG